MANFFEDEKKYPDNKPRENFIFLGYPFEPPLPLDDYRKAVKELQAELPLRFWYFLDEITTAEMMRKIWRAILRSDLAVFDISRGNPNVALELGLALGVNKTCMTILKTGEANPLGRADLGYAERAEYQSVTTLKDTLRRLAVAKSSGLRKIRDISYRLHDPAQGTREDLEKQIAQVLHTVFVSKKVTKAHAEKTLGQRRAADSVLDTLRENGVLQIEGQKGGAKWVFTDAWVHGDHEVAGE